MKNLKYDGFIHPFAMRHLPARATVQNSQIEFGGMIFTFTDEPFENGTEVEISCPRNFIARSIEEIEAERRAADQKREVARAANLERINAQRAANLAFNQSLQIPVAWVPEIKIVLSGLLEHSNGNGARRNTVSHVYFLEDFTRGKLKRKAHQYLCSQPSAHFPVDQYGHLENRTLEDYAVNCRQCLKLLKK
jgi:hypothetical protein